MAQIHLDKCRAKKLNSYPFNTQTQNQQPHHNTDVSPTLTKEPDSETADIGGTESGRTLNIDDQCFQKWLTSS
ncbi:hypothetical protein BV898_01881 [Hypsibius exemplaris]|uniref:Uncharacterized protein n=1 Tax=Hypsibius exemplaris TaxID=2072580 RepID=A0A1W0XA23_HYPEX|nr:hypothetical protein BV898_01881 [Hypsibius exemplaris]